MKKHVKILLSDRLIFVSFLASLSLIVLHLLVVIFFYSKLPPLIPLFNQMPWGEQRLGTKEQISLPLLITLLILTGNAILATISYQKMPLPARILSVTTLLITFFGIIFTIRTMQLLL